MPRNEDRNVRCSFCGKYQDQVSRLIAGPNVYICNECIELCASILHDEMVTDDGTQFTLPDTLPTPKEIKTSMDGYIIGQEEAKIALRNNRRDAMDTLKKMKTAKELSEDDFAACEADVEKTVSGAMSKLEGVISAKEKDLMSI